MSKCFKNCKTPHPHANIHTCIMTHNYVTAQITWRSVNLCGLCPKFSHGWRAAALLQALCSHNCFSTIPRTLQYYNPHCTTCGRRVVGDWPVAFVWTLWQRRTWDPIQPATLRPPLSHTACTPVCMYVCTYSIPLYNICMYIIQSSLMSREKEGASAANVCYWHWVSSYVWKVYL